jgi:hypothetical protein
VPPLQVPERVPVAVGREQTFFFRAASQFAAGKSFTDLVRADQKQVQASLSNLYAVARRSQGAVTYEQLKQMTPFEAEIIIDELNRQLRLEAEAITGNSGSTINIHEVLE